MGLPDFSRLRPTVEETNGILIEVRSQYFPEESNPKQNLYYFVYEITVVNNSAIEAQLMNRHWVITDANGHTEEIVGEGVVGQQPLIPPEHEFRYVSACPLWTNSGYMEGSYEMKQEDGATFEVRIPKFRLGKPTHLRLVKS